MQATTIRRHSMGLIVTRRCYDDHLITRVVTNPRTRHWPWNWLLTARGGGRIVIQGRFAIIDAL
jgi:hypothetical protein